MGVWKGGKSRYICKQCKEQFYRYPSTVSNPERVFCGKLCRYKFQETSLKGKNNPNYRHGRNLDTRRCRCGNKLDYRARVCINCRKLKFTEAEVLEAVSKSQHYSQAAAVLGIGRTSLIYLIKRFKLKLSLEHFTYGRDREIPNNLLFQKGTPLRYGTVKKRVIRDGLLPQVCSFCKVGPEWNSEPLVLELDHIDGDRTNNELSNLRMLCPNCHSQTPTHRGKNHGKWEGVKHVKS